MVPQAGDPARRAAHRRAARSHLTRTIAAIATPRGAGALSVVRLSGPKAREVLLSAFTPDGSGELLPRVVRHGSFLDLDDGLAWWAPAPSTYTGEEVAEFSGHGGGFLTARVLDALLARGAVAAEPGEFTRRAFLNGRMDLARAEAVADLIAASTEEALRVARSQLEGALSRRIEQLREETLDALAHLEAGIDFPEEDIDPQGAAELSARFGRVAERASALAGTFRRGRLLREGARVAIVGRPNVGKSSLLNALAGRERAIVTDEPGTTRDVVEEAVDLGGIPVTLTDTAGIREAEGAAEREGVRRSRLAAGQAELALFVYDLSAGMTREDESAREALVGLPGERVLVVGNKLDLAGEPGPAADVVVSAKSGKGVDGLKEQIVRRLALPAGEAESVVVTNARHHASLEAASAHLARAGVAAGQQISPDLVASDARRGLEALDAILGKGGPEEVLNRIFQRFCLGK